MTGSRWRKVESKAVVKLTKISLCGGIRQKKKLLKDMVKSVSVFLLYKCKTNEIALMGFYYNAENLFSFLYYTF